MKKALVSISGSISAYKVADIISGLKVNNFEVRVITTKNALKFITPTVLGSISGGNYITEENVNVISHIEEAQNCDVFICVPATYNIIGKFSNGVADDFVTSVFAAIPKETPKIICPAMNTKMWENKVNQINLDFLNEFLGCSIIYPTEGILACGDKGIGKLKNPRKIVEEILEILDNSEPWKWPLPLTPIGTTIDSYSFLDVNLNKEVEIPLYPHRGVDLYAPVGTEVFAVEDGTVSIANGIRPWTGKIADCDWWEDTWALMVEGKSGMVVYGEIKIDKSIYEEKEKAKQTLKKNADYPFFNTSCN